MKFKKPQRMVDKPKTGNDSDRAHIKEARSAPIASIVESNSPAIASESQTENANKSRNYSSYIAWPFVAIWRFVFKPGFSFIERHHASVTALATVAIVVLTFLYVRYSKRQWNVMKGQLEELQSTNRPYVFILPMLGHPMTEHFTDVAATIGIGNFGNSPAIEEIHSEPVIGIDTDYNMVERLRTCSVSYPIGGIKNILAPSQLSKGIGITTKTVTRYLASDVRASVLSGASHVVVFGGVKYSGIRGGDYETTYCLIWEPKSASNSNILAWQLGPQCPCTKMK